ncbi:hypothetical protein BP5796_09606 [Coleophoma crateriformis]|uniref:Mitochondrial zinc maintenance protein 1, mitochondrial n=1 Tax=Coleophoma crateriformis TaxID=565419 RepID=A0A3D8QYK7_9HELO|nr:hypothetical protein BP5796_09606 [Coleophoma crateriformis]
MALQAYRHVLRSARIAFEGKYLLEPETAPQDKRDLPLLTAAKKEARSGFLKNASMAPGDPQLAAAITHAEEVARILKENIVQGKKKADEDMYKLRIHEHTERGDNDTVKMPNGQKVVIDGKKCSER